MSVLYTPPMQQLGTGDEFTNAQSYFSGMVNSVFGNETVMDRFGMRQVVSDGKTWEFPFVALADHYEHNPGSQLPDRAQPLTEERTVVADEKEIGSHAYVAQPQRNIVHYDVFGPYARASAESLARARDSRTIRTCLIGARQDARGPNNEFPAGNLQRRNAATIAAGYPRTAAGSRAVQEDLAAIRESMDNKNVPRENRFALVTPYILSVLLRDQNLLQADIADPNNPNRKLTSIMERVEGFQVIMTNQLPSTNVTTGDSKYQGDFTKTAMLCLQDDMPFGYVEFNGGLGTEGPLWYPDRRSWLVAAALHMGVKWLRPECLGEVYVSTSEYTLSNGVYGP